MVIKNNKGDNLMSLVRWKRRRWMHRWWVISHSLHRRNKCWGKVGNWIGMSLWGWVTNYKSTQKVSSLIDNSNLNNSNSHKMIDNNNTSNPNSNKKNNKTSTNSTRWNPKKWTNPWWATSHNKHKQSSFITLREFRHIVILLRLI